MSEFEFERSEILTNLALLEDHAQKFPCPYCMEKHLKAVGIPPNEFNKVGEITVLRCTIMSPWPALTRGGKPDYIFEFGSKLEKIIERKAREHFLGRPSDPKDN